ncbi:MMPL family transporter [Streptomyces millisiae]|uniref:MMPL family transporter n=1 Tax=Streptomyces millisiae TaxID=3075542 RepID=A0ABU2LIV1_9ACTN|nr:MMPL family transporter [Streptomyces sp. DSM 44918]MDT0317178.1 MMPL family transporter [Streptomyces sp. DSM 44918]
MFSWLGRFAYGRRRGLLVAAALFVVVAGAWGSGVFNAMGSGGYTAPEAEANRANALLEEHFGHQPGDVDAAAVYTDPTGELTVDDAEFEQAVTEALARLPESEVISSTSYWSPELTPEQRAEYVAEDGRSVLATITLRGEDSAERLESYGDIQDEVRASGLETYLGGGFTSEYQLQRLATENLATAQLISLPILLVLLLVIFRGLVAAAIPVALGIMAILGSMVLLRGLTYVTDVSIFALEISTLLGLGLAIDYGLFMVSRFRQELERRDGEVAEALAATMNTAGRTVAFSGLTVVIGLCGLLFFPQPVSRSFGFGGITVVLFDIAAALLVLPAALAVLGPRINALSLPWPRRAAATVSREDRAWARLARAVTRRPLPWLTGGLLALLVAAAPLLSLEPGMTNHRYLPVTNEGQVVAGMLNEEFPPDGPAGTRVDIAVSGPVERGAIDDYLDTLAGLDGATETAVHRADAELTWVTVAHRGEADDAANLDLVREIRALDPPAGATEVLVGGLGGPALSLDNTEATTDSLPWALVFVGLSSLVLLFLAFRSVLVPVKAVLVAFLSLAASLGIIVWGFQEGGLAGLLDFHEVGTTDVWTLGLIVTIAFGLVTDYEMFLVSRVSEEYQATGDNHRAIDVGLRSTGSVITRAALLMIVVLAAMGFTATSLFLMTLGIGLTLSVVIDATVVRSIIVPAAMQLLGHANWWPGRPRRSDDRPDPPSDAHPARGAVVEGEPIRNA